MLAQMKKIAHENRAIVVSLGKTMELNHCKGT
jgi:hypothetical protein